MYLKILAAGAIAGVVANITGFVITGMLFHRFQAETPNTWRAPESWTHYSLSAAIRLVACIAIALVYAGIGTGNYLGGANTLWRGAGFGVCLWAVLAVPLTLELALFVKWHRGFVVGLLLDWLVLCVVANVASSIAQPA
jgi:hypothetical protein